MAHFTLPERELLYRLKKQGLNNAEIGRLMGRHRANIGRELKRNTGQRGYRPLQAQRLADERRVNCRRPHKLADPEVHRYVEERLNKYWSPDQIAGRVRRDYPRARRRWLSRQTIYNWIDARAPEWRALLRRGGRPPETRGKLRDCVRISGRPEVINRRRRYGDWEGDTIQSGRRRSAVLTLVERKSGFTRLGRLDSMHSAATMRRAHQRLKQLPRSLRRSVTFDNGKEFAEHRQLTRRLGIDVFFADTYASWQRGTNENTNGLIRQYFPKGTDFTRISHQAVARVERSLNERPRRRLGYRTPAEILAPRAGCA